MISKFAVIFIVLIAASMSVFGQFVGGGVVSGKLLKSNGKPLPYTEIELVPTFYDAQVRDKRFWATSNAAGDFSFSDVPSGDYTLSINFDEKPSVTSPYQTFFYPNHADRSEAETIKIAPGGKVTGLKFRVPPPLVQRKVSGKVVNAKGDPIEGAYVYLRDVLFDQSLILDNKTDKFGNFTLMGFETRKYQIGALIYEESKPQTFESPGKVLAIAYSEIFILSEKNPNFTLVLEESDELKKIKEKNVGMLISSF